ncbi:MAG TPA: hypothetical protein VEL07_14660 [Planctomycetota bacterium]|nr:hypothetical protein [Planctomycetota bacterium]
MRRTFSNPTQYTSGSPGRPARPVPRAAFSLFEIAICLGILTMSVVTVLMQFSAGIRVQQQVRYRTYAAAKAQEILDVFATTHNANPHGDQEGREAWDVGIGYSNFAPDLERRVANMFNGVAPVPPSIARRLDSPGDEIARILDRGGNLYYALPTAATGLQEAGLPRDHANELQKVVFAVDGYAQANAMHGFPWKAWPYSAAYPSPPVHAPNRAAAFLPGHARTFPLQFPVWNDPDPTKPRPEGFPFYVWEEISDPSDAGADWPMRKVFDWIEDARDPAARYGFLAYGYDAPVQVPGTPWKRVDPPAFSSEGAVRYLQGALWYASRIGLPQPFYDPGPSPVPLADPPPPYDPDPMASTRIFARGGGVAVHKQVQAMRFLAHAATCMTRWKTLAELGGQPSSGGLAVPSVTIDGAPSPAIILSHDLITYYHESCLNLAMKYAASFPYDWGAPRPAQRAIMMDVPLLEWQVFASRSGAPSGAIDPNHRCEQWLPLSAQPLVNPGVSMSYPDLEIPDGRDHAFWGDPARFTVTAPFAPTERCRQLVFWSADWKSYEDAETAPSAPVDASRYPIAGPVPGADFRGRMWATGKLPITGGAVFSYVNPEHIFLFNQPMGAIATGTNADPFTNFGTGQDHKGFNPNFPLADVLDTYCGVHGADRDFNRQLDRGPVPTTVRMRAHPLNRFNFYDPRIAFTLR